jgi:hypothetical protein
MSEDINIKVVEETINIKIEGWEYNPGTSSDLPITTDANDVIVGSATIGTWVKKTLSQFKTILGLGSAAYTDSTAYMPAGTVIVTTDEKVKYDAADTAAGYLADKIIAGSRITIAEGTGADENKLKITADVQTTDISGKVDKVSGSSLVPDTEISKIHALNADAETATSIAAIINGIAADTLDDADTFPWYKNTGGLLKKITWANIKAVFALAGHAHTGTYQPVGSYLVAADITGKVNGPANNTADYIPQWNGTDSKTLKDGLAVPAGGLAGLTALGEKLSDVVNDTTPQLGGDLDMNGKNLDFGAILSSNSTYKGYILTVTVDSNATGIGAVLAQGSDFNFDLADADAVANTNMIVIALEAGTGSKKVLLPGSQICLTAWNWSAGKIYLDTTDGGITQTAPSGTDDVIIVLGYALSADTIYFMPGIGFIEHT